MKIAIQEKWDKETKIHFWKHIKNISKRCKQVIKAKSCWSKYWLLKFWIKMQTLPTLNLKYSICFVVVISQPCKVNIKF